VQALADELSIEDIHAILIWNTLQISRIVDTLRQTGTPVASSSLPAKPFGTDAATRLKICSRAQARCSPAEH
jgi:hypothetical protein